ncbi:hypothetical protein K3G63_11035 [Hymenobacter sp. HSC-4F20]|uniref:hypothetical protein n=1 Tax=Hymenobacter sp. HSC-4F20 TaxID=2864135 RepID=UPI001C72BDFC|nr:hypothetical protein [Hymenobacter sp. HSC-4F20]MBX0290977.1 hypothetical protein [Hymenobacter sp. HSC-4F20]
MTYHPHINTAAYSVAQLEARLVLLEQAERSSTRPCAPRTTELRAIRKALTKRTTNPQSATR